MARFLILYSSVDGQTVKICTRLRRILETAGHRVALHPLEACPAVERARCDRLVIGASVRYGRHRPAVAAFVRRWRALLAVKSTVFFSVNLAARRPGKDQPDTNPYCRRFLQQLGWQPAHAAVFAGRLDYPALGHLNRSVIRLIMAMTGGPTDPATVAEFTDWEAVDRFGRILADSAP